MHYTVRLAVVVTFPCVVYNAERSCNINNVHEFTVEFLRWD